MQSIKVTIPTPEPADPLAMPSGPSFVGINIPYELIHWAKTYPAIDWNDIMRYAMENHDRRNGEKGVAYNTTPDYVHPDGRLCPGDKFLVGEDS